MDQQPSSSPPTNVLDPARTVSLFHLKNGDYVADFGSGHGYFVIPMAKSVAPDGKIFAIDIQRHMLDVVRAKSQTENIHNAEYIWSDLERPQGSKLKNDFVDFVLITNILHQSDHKEAIIQEAYRILRPEGRLALIEWEAGSPDSNTDETKEANDVFGPPVHMRVSRKAATNFCESRSFAFEKEFDAGNHHYGILFVKKPK